MNRSRPLTMLAGAAAAPLIALAVAACGHGGVRTVGGHAQLFGASPEVRRRLELTRVYRLVMRCSPTNGNDAA
jgi:hypothetical protein